MKRLLILSAILFLAIGASANAAGLGFFVEGANGSGDAEWDSDNYEWDLDQKSGSVGFVLDTAPMNESGFNYRLNVGLSSMNWEDDGGGDIDLGGIYCENIFGFAFVKKETFRWWGGPLLRIGYFSGDEDDLELNVLEFGLGAATGINFKVGNSLILSPSIGLRFNGYAGTGEWSDYYREDEDDYTASATTGFFNFALLF